MKYIINTDDLYGGDIYKSMLLMGTNGKGEVIVQKFNLDELEELTADYINEHFGQLQDEAYKRGFEDGKGAIHAGCAGCQNEGTKIFELPCSTCRNAYPNHWTAKKQDDEIKVGDEVRWGMDLIVITRLYIDGGFKWCDGISKEGIAFHVLEESVSKTNRHFDIESILEAMG